MDTCDYCGKEFPRADRINICRARPSDPAELCLVMAICPPCHQEQHDGKQYLTKGGAIGTGKFLDDLFEDGTAGKLGLIWLSI